MDRQTDGPDWIDQMDRETDGPDGWTDRRLTDIRTNITDGLNSRTGRRDQADWLNGRTMDQIYGRTLTASEFRIFIFLINLIF